MSYKIALFGLIDEGLDVSEEDEDVDQIEKIVQYQ